LKILKDIYFIGNTANYWMLFPLVMMVVFCTDSNILVV